MNLVVSVLVMIGYIGKLYSRTGVPTTYYFVVSALVSLLLLPISSTVLFLYLEKLPGCEELQGLDLRVFDPDNIDKPSLGVEERNNDSNENDDEAESSNITENV